QRLLGSCRFLLVLGTGTGRPGGLGRLVLGLVLGSAGVLGGLVGFRSLVRFGGRSGGVLGGLLGLRGLCGGGLGWFVGLRVFDGLGVLDSEGFSVSVSVGFDVSVSEGVSDGDSEESPSSVGAVVVSQSSLPAGSSTSESSETTSKLTFEESVSDLRSVR